MDYEKRGENLENNQEPTDKNNKSLNQGVASFFLLCWLLKEEKLIPS